MNEIYKNHMLLIKNYTKQQTSLFDFLQLEMRLKEIKFDANNNLFQDIKIKKR